MELADPLHVNKLTPLDRCRAESLLKILSSPISLDQSRVKDLRELTGLTSLQFDKSLNLLIESGLVSVESGIGSVIAQPTDAGKQLREIL